MYLTRGGSVQRLLTSGTRWWRASRSARFYVSLAHGFTHKCLHEKGEARALGKVGGGRTTWSAGHMARPVGHHLVKSLTPP
jgi:hypothetical protein